MKKRFRPGQLTPNGIYWRTAESGVWFRFGRIGGDLSKVLLVAMVAA